MLTNALQGQGPLRCELLLIKMSVILILNLPPTPLPFVFVFRPKLPRFQFTRLTRLIEETSQIYLENEDVITYKKLSLQEFFV